MRPCVHLLVLLYYLLIIAPTSGIFGLRTMCVCMLFVDDGDWWECTCTSFILSEAFHGNHFKRNKSEGESNFLSAQVLVHSQNNYCVTQRIWWRIDGGASRKVSSKCHHKITFIFGSDSSSGVFHFSLSVSVHCLLCVVPFFGCCTTAVQFLLGMHYSTTT